MKRNLLLAGALLAVGLTASAEFKAYFPTYNDQAMTLGSVYAVSPNGKYAVVGDDQNNMSYLWEASNPEVLTSLNKSGFRKIVVFDINDNGDIVGQNYVTGGKFVPVARIDGEWQTLPIDDLYALNINFARKISDDGKYIGGISVIADPNIETGKGYRAVLWTRNEQGEYEQTTYAEFPKEVDHHQGFWANGMTNDGIIYGYIMCGATQCEIPAFVKDGQYVYFNKVEEVMEPFFYPAKGKYEGVDPETGRQIWLDDPTDPRLALYPSYYIDGFKDTTTENNFTGGFAYYDEDTRCFYGYRTVAEDVKEDGTGKLRRGATYYSLDDNEFVDDFSEHMYTMHHAGVYFITKGGTQARVVANGLGQSLHEYFGLSDLAHQPAGIQDCDKEGKVFGGMYSEMNPATGETDYYPMIIADIENTGVDSVVTNENIRVKAVNGIINVEGGVGLVYTMDGKLVGNGTEIAVESGLYLVKVSDRTVKVMVK